MSSFFENKILTLIKEKDINGMEEFLKLNSFDSIFDVVKANKLQNDFEKIIENIPSKGYIRYLREGEKLK